MFDNTDDLDPSLTLYFPAGDRGDIIITSRNPEWQQYHTVGWREIGQMSDEDSEALLLKTAYGDIIPDNRLKRQGQQIRQKVKTLGCLALAIVQAGGCIRETSCGLEVHPERYRQR